MDDIRFYTINDWPGMRLEVNHTTGYFRGFRRGEQAFGWGKVTGGIEWATTLIRDGYWVPEIPDGLRVREGL